MSETWWRILLQIVIGVVGGFTGGWAVAFRWGQWRQHVDDRLEYLKTWLQKHEKRLEAGEEPLDKVPVQNAQINTLIDQIKRLRSDMQDMRQRYVTEKECDRRHGNGGDQGEGG